MSAPNEGAVESKLVPKEGALAPKPVASTRKPGVVGNERGGAPKTAVFAPKQVGVGRGREG